MEDIHRINFYNYLKVLLFTPEEPWRIGAVALGDRGYICYRCSAMFKFKDQFICHINRKIMMIEYNCTRCSPEQTYVFYNGCTWFMHVRSHFQMIRYPKVELDKIKVQELPIGEVSVSDEPTIYIDEEIPIESENEFIDPFMYQPIMNEETTSLVRLQRVGIWFKRRTLTIRQICKNMPKCEIISVNVFRRLIAHISLDNTDSTNVDIKEEFTEEPVIIQDPAAGSSKEDSFPKCLECNQYPENTMYNHFLEANLPRSKSFECSTCHLITPTLCSHLAHKRIHQKEPPHVCPECGKEFPNHNLLENHMSITCFHNSKAVRYNCPAPKCWKIFATTQNFTKHMSNHYMVKWFCKTCNTHFPTHSEIQLHFTRSGHNDIVKFQKCLLCPSENQLFTLKIQEHTEMHVNDMDNYIYVNVCTVCKKVFKSVERFSSHLYLSCGKYVVLDQHHNTISGGSYQENVRQTAKSVEPAISSKSAMENKDKLLMCTFCGGIMEYCYGQEHVKTCKIDLKPNLTFIDPTNGSICKKGHRNTSQINKGQNSLSDEPSQKKPKSNINYDIGEGSNKSPSIKENKDNFQSVPSQEGSYKGKMGEKTIRKRGKKDTGTISNPSENGIGKFFQLSQPVSLSEVKQDINVTQFAEVIHCIAKNFEKKTKFRKLLKPSINRRKRKPSKDVANQPKMNIIPTERTPNILNGIYGCIVCGYKSKDRGDFAKHVKSHKTGMIYQCMDCGESFLVKRTLCMHLKTVHGIWDTNKYIVDNECCDNEVKRQLLLSAKLAICGVSSEPVGENQCKVCKESFSCKLQLDLHFRGHGLAFLLTQKS